MAVTHFISTRMCTVAISFWQRRFSARVVEKVEKFYHAYFNTESIVIIAHGAANDMNSSLIVAVVDGLVSAGYTTLRFNFPYKDKGKKSPDTEPTLVRTWQSVASHILNNERLPVDRVVAAGKPMGGRIASQMVAAE